MNSALVDPFLAFVGILVLVVAAAIARYVPERFRQRTFAAFGAFVAYGAVLGGLGILGNPALRPPGILYALVPTIGFTAFLAGSRTGGTIAASVPVAFLIGAQTLRLVVELFIDRLWHAGLVPTLLTLPGGNVDILVGLSAPVVAVLYATRRIDARVALGWNILGVASLANVVLRGVLGSPILHVIPTDVAAFAIGTFPFTFIPTLVVPVALQLHVLAVRALSRDARTARRGSPSLRGEVAL